METLEALVFILVAWPLIVLIIDSVTKRPKD